MEGAKAFDTGGALVAENGVHLVDAEFIVAGGTFVIGGYGAGIYNQTGGVVTASNGSTSSSTSGTTVTVTTATMTGITTATLARNTGSSAIYNLGGGNLNVGNLIVGGSGPATFTQTGGTVNGQTTVTTVSNNVSGSSPTNHHHLRQQHHARPERRFDRNLQPRRWNA